MLKEQAISLLTQVKKIILGSESWLDSVHQPIEEAFSMAIEAIKSTQPNTPNTLNALDTIYRQAAIDVLEEGREMLSRVLDDTDVVGNEREKFEWGLGLIEPYINDMIELPSAQPEIILCEECKHRDPENRKCDCGHDILWQLPRQDDWFCGDAERREE